MLDKKNLRDLILLLCNVLVLSIGHGKDIKIFILIALIFFVINSLRMNRYDFLPMMLFYLPWSTVMKFDSESFTWFTFIIPIFFIYMCFFRRKQENAVKIPYQHILLALTLIGITLLAKVISQNKISFSYIIFITMIIFFPIYLKTYKEKICFEKCILFLTFGVISACVAAEILMKYPHMMQYIDIYSWEQKGLIRLSGFYGDANFYSVHIILAISGILIISMMNKFNTPIFYISILLILIYFGMKSVSKMFLFITLGIVGLWVVSILISKLELKIKIGILVGIMIGISFICLSGIFDNVLFMYTTRLEMSNNISSLTTGRFDLVLKYSDYFQKNPKELLIGIGLSERYPEGINKAAHNTILQLIYQLGIVGSIVVSLWIKCIGENSILKNKKIKSYSYIYVLILFIGCFFPWVSLDILFFDEFFYIILVYILGINYIKEKEYNKEEAK